MSLFIVSVNITLDSWPSKMEPIRCPETSVRNYHYTLRNLPEERRFHYFRTLYIQLCYTTTPFGRFLPSSGSLDNNLPPLKVGAMGCPETSVTTYAGCVTSRQSEDLKAWVLTEVKVRVLRTLQWNCAFSWYSRPSKQA